MKKTVQVNLNGLVFTLDEDAYEQLSAYLKRIGLRYQNSQGKDEILSDIEARIAELLQEMIHGQKQVVGLVDVQSVMNILGDPEQFESDDDGQEAAWSIDEEQSSKRLFRDPDNRILSGVCSGIAYYFGIDPVWIRLAFGLAFIFFGTGFFLYILLWIIIPEARTTADRLHMKGKPININNIGNAIERELDGLGKRVSDAGQRFGKVSGKKVENGVDRLAAFLVEFFSRLFLVVGKLIGGILVFVGLFALVALVAGALGVADMVHFGATDWDVSMSIYEWGDLVFNSSDWLLIAVFAFVLLLGIPFISILYGGLILLFPKVKVPFLGASLTGLWFVGLILAIFTGFSTAKEFSKEETIVQRNLIPDSIHANDTLIITVASDPFNIPVRRAYSARNDFMMKVSDRRIIMGNIDFSINKSKDDQVWVEVSKTANAASYEVAEQRADSILYRYTVEANKIAFHPYFTYPQIQLLRSQEVRVLLTIPIGKTVFLAEEVKRIMEDIPNITNTYDPEMVGHYWRMEEDGLTCLDCMAEEEATQNTVQQAAVLSED
jgi:phage shock protein PspC (stress-responsive transcriptional regulator)